jgi:crotonobetainyl-CoA:carnitine CoA-transferase CaiB-like acyl-CoA transferase
MTAPAATPLGGLRVLETASLYAAPLVATFLADHGADVTKVEPLGGDPYRHWPALWALVGRRKQSLTLDLTQPRGQETLRRLLPHVDVVVENLPRRVAEQRGLTYEDMAACNPRLVVVTATGLGHDGPYRGRPANGTLSEAFAGLTYLTGEPDGAPMLPSVPLGDVIAASFGAMGVLAACLRQRQTGAGGHVDLTSYDPILHAVGPALSGYLPGGPVPERLGGRSPGSGVRGTFQCSDGGWVAIGTSNAEHERRIRDLIGDTDPLVDDHERVRQWIARRSRAEVIDGLVAARVPATPVNTMTDLWSDPHVEARHSLVPVVGEGLPAGSRVAAPTPRIDGDPVDAACPALGSANAALLRDTLQMSDGEVAELVGNGPLAPSPTT